MAYTITINGKHEYRITDQGGRVHINGEELRPDMAETEEGHFHLLLNNRSYQVELLEFDREEKSGRLRVNGRIYTFSARDRYDELLERLGMSAGASHRFQDLKAPMPGLVLQTLVSSGQQVAKGENLLVLEAMKMENIIKSPGEGTVDTLYVKPGDAVEKGQVLIKFA